MRPMHGFFLRRFHPPSDWLVANDECTIYGSYAKLERKDDHATSHLTCFGYSHGRAGGDCSHCLDRLPS